MGVTRWALVGLVGLLVAGCVSPATPPPAATTTPTRTPAPTVALTHTSVPVVVPPTPTVAPTPTRPAPTTTPTKAAPGVIITILYDNNEYDERLTTAWGFSCLVEGAEKAILFDTGGDSATLLSNMRTLGIEPQNVEVVVISHIHGDHVGGLAGLLQENHTVTVYLPQSFPQNIKQNTRGTGAEVVEVGGPVEICENVYSTGELGDGIKEQSLVIETARGLVVITGCAHPGVVNIVRRAKEVVGGEVYLVLGGFHLGSASRRQVERIIADFRDLGVQKVAPCHCTGDRAIRVFGEEYGEDFIRAGMGCVITIGRRTNCQLVPPDSAEGLP